MRIGIVTCRVLPEPDPDQNPLLEALARAGHEPSMLPWNGPGDPAAFDACIVRSTWDYYHNPDAFRAWINRAGEATRLLNPAPALLWNMDKAYLRELEAGGVPIVPTAWCDRGEPLDLAAAMDRRNWPEAVVKPRISAASWRTRRFRRTDAADGQRFLNELASQRDAMVQRFMASVEDMGELGGERSLVWIHGELTHAIRKGARFHDEHESVSETIAPTDAERTFATRVLAATPFDAHELLYARVDIMTADDGAMLLSELELLEPSLFLLQCPAALQRFVLAIERQVRDGASV